MELNQLRCFVCAAEHQSISRAAKVLLISQPSLSRILKSLEEELGGVRLFIRTNSGIELTEAGRLLLNDAREMLFYEEKIKNGISYISAHEERPIRLVSRCIGRLMCESVIAFTEKYPNSRFVTLQNDDLAIFNMQYDLMISSYIESREKLVSKELMTERFLCAVSKDSPAALNGSLSLEEFASMPQVLFGGHRYVGRMVSEKLRALGLKYKVTAQCDDSNTACHLVGAGRGVLLIPEYTLCNELLSTVCLVPVTGLDFTRNVYLSWPANSYPSDDVKRYRSFLIQFLTAKHTQK